MISSIILAAGESKRLGEPKQLLPWDQNTILEQVVDNYLASRVDEVIIVLGYKAEAISRLGNAKVIPGEFRPFKLGRLFESLLSAEQPGLYGSLKKSRPVFGGLSKNRFGFIRAGTTGRDIVRTGRAYAAFGVQRLADLLSEVGSEIGIPGTSHNLKSLTERIIGRSATVKRGPFLRTLFSTVSLSSFLVQKNQSLQSISLSSIRSFAVPQEPAGPIITSSPGRQSAGVATPNSSAVFKAIITLYNSSKLRPKLKG